MNYCPNCGQKMEGRFCSNCGYAAADGGAPVSSAQTEESRFKSTIFGWAGTNFLVFLGTLLSLGIAYPWLVCFKQRYIASRTHINGRKQYFDGRGHQLIGKYIGWLLLCLITLGIYSFWLKLKMRKWIAKHTHFEGSGVEGQSDFDGGLLELVGITLASNLLTAITLGIASFWMHCWKERYYQGHTVIDGQRLRFNGTGAQYFGKKIVWCLLTAVTLGIYYFWLALKSQQWTVKHTVMEHPELLPFHEDRLYGEAELERQRILAEKKRIRKEKQDARRERRSRPGWQTATRLSILSVILVLLIVALLAFGVELYSEILSDMSELKDYPLLLIGSAYDNDDYCYNYTLDASILFFDEYYATAVPLCVGVSAGIILLAVIGLVVCLCCRKNAKKASRTKLKKLILVLLPVYLLVSVFGVALAMLPSKAAEAYYEEKENISSSDGFVYEENKTGYTIRFNTRYPVLSGDVTLPSSYNGKPITVLDLSVPDDIWFSGEGEISTLMIPNSITEIKASEWDNRNIFYEVYSLERLVFEDNAQIKYFTADVVSAFSGSWGHSLKIIDFGEHNALESIGDSAFRDCYSLTTVDFGANSQLTSIGDSAFSGCGSLTSITIPASVTRIGDYAFSDCTSLTTITISEGVTSIGNGAFYYCGSLISITLPSSVTSIGNDAFYGCDNIQNATIPTSAISSIPKTNLVTVVINGGTSIGEKAFRDCDSLTTVEFAANSQLTSIGDYAFYDCDSLTTVYYGGSASDWGNISIKYYGNSNLTSATRYYYSATQPTVAGNWWYYDNDGKPAVWPAVEA